MTNKEELIVKRLRLFEQEQKRMALADPAHGELRVLLAVEEGSRAWNLHCSSSSPSSSASDFDVRFIYMRSPQHYLSIEQAKKDSLRFEDGSIPADFSGWDIRKALTLLRESNPSLLDWLRSPSYISDPIFVSSARELANLYHSRKALAHHYLSVARKHHVTYFTPTTTPDPSSSSELDSEVVQLKKYFYVLRPLFMVRWLATHPRCGQPSSSSYSSLGSPPTSDLNLPPMDFELLLSEASSGLSSSLQELLLLLVKEKREGRLSSAARGPRISQLDRLIDQLFVEASLYAQGVAIVEDETFKTDKPPATEEFNHLFYTTVLGSFS